MPSLSTPQSQRNRRLAQEQEGFFRSRLLVARCVRFECQLPKSPAWEQNFVRRKVMALMHQRTLRQFRPNCPYHSKIQVISDHPLFQDMLCVQPNNPGAEVLVSATRRRIRQHFDSVSVSMCWCWAVCVGALRVSTLHLWIFLNRPFEQTPKWRIQEFNGTHISFSFSSVLSNFEICLSFDIILCNLS